jgi:hypothetical protein
MTVVVRGANDMSVYLNGIELPGRYEGASNLPMNSASPKEIARIGSLFSNGKQFRFKGMIDEFRIWNRALSTDDIRRTMCRRLNASEPGLIGYWNFDEVKGSKVYDLSVNKLHGKLVGHPVRVLSSAPVGDDSDYMYVADVQGFSWDGVLVNNIQNGSAGIQIYKVQRGPSRTKGLTEVAKDLPYYGIYMINDGTNTRFDIQVPWETFLRKDNAAPAWEEKRPERIENRTEVLFVPRVWQLLFQL